MLGQIRFLGVLGTSVFFFTSAMANAQTLSNRAVYQRCYSKLVRMAPGSDDPFIPLIASGGMTGATACRALLRLALFGTDGRIPAYTSEPVKYELAKRVLTAMNDFHTSWFANKDWEGSSPVTEDPTKAMIDTQEPAYFLTRALFDTDFNFNSLLTGDDNLRALRSENAPANSIIRANITPASYYTFIGAVQMIGNGDLLGIGLESPAVSPLKNRVRFTGEVAPTLGNVNVRRSLGGGIIGSQAYVMNNFGEDPQLHATLAKMPRTWSKYIFKDFLCRNLPVIAASDAAPFEVCRPTATHACAITPSVADAPNVLPFRADKACTQCHASMDQLGGIMRNERSWVTGNFSIPDMKYGTLNVFPGPATKPLLKTWPYLEDQTYNEHPAYGRLFYRDHKNLLVNTELNNLNELAVALRNSDDYYICASKRYFEYFTGININNAPMTAAQENTLLSKEERYYRRLVINNLALGVGGFKTHKDPKKLIEAIFALPEYKQRISVCFIRLEIKGYGHGENETQK